MRRSSASRAPEILFSSVEEMNDAFSSGRLKPVQKVEGHQVRAKPKIGAYTASVEYWLVLFHYMYESVPTRYWGRGIFSCLVTISIANTVVDGVISFTSWLGSFL